MTLSMWVGQGAPTELHAVWIPCAYCGRADEPESNRSCKGCGAQRKRGHKIDVTTFKDSERRYWYAEE